MRTRVFLTVLLAWIVSSGAIAQSTITTEDLQHHRWVLESIDGEPLPVSGGKIPELDFGEQMTVSGNLGCNQMNGQAVLRDGYFLIEAMATTRMMCSQPWNDIELKLTTMLGSESTAIIDADKKLTLTSAVAVLVFTLADRVAAAEIDPAIRFQSRLFNPAYDTSESSVWVVGPRAILSL